MLNVEMALDMMREALTRYSRKEYTKEMASQNGLSILQDYFVEDLENYLLQDKDAANLILDDFICFYRDCKIDIPPYIEESIVEYEKSGNISVSIIAELIVRWVDLTQSSLRKKLATQDHDMTIGAMVAGLMFFGSNRHQAENFVAVWQGISYESVQKKHVNWRSWYPDISKEEYLIVQVEFAKEMMEETTRKIPSEFKSALEAYNNLEVYLRDVFKRPELIVIEE